jgi:nucleoside-diphosphate-sugar epimerase
MQALVRLVHFDLGLPDKGFYIPKWLGLIASYGFDIMSKLTGKTFPVSSVRIQKFCANTTFNTEKLQSTGFVPPYTLEEGLKRTIKHDFLS